MKQITVQDRSMQTIQQNAATAISNLEVSAAINTQTSTTQPITAPFTGGHILANVALTASQDNIIPHQLQQAPQVWVITNNNTNSVIWSPVTTQLGGQSANAQYLNLWCSATTTISLWVA